MRRLIPNVNRLKAKLKPTDFNTERQAKKELTIESHWAHPLLRWLTNTRVGNKDIVLTISALKSY